MHIKKFYCVKHFEITYWSNQKTNFKYRYNVLLYSNDIQSPWLYWLNWRRNFKFQISNLTDIITIVRFHYNVSDISNILNLVSNLTNIINNIIKQSRLIMLY